MCTEHIRSNKNVLRIWDYIHIKASKSLRESKLLCVLIMACDVLILINFFARLLVPRNQLI